MESSSLLRNARQLEWIPEPFLHEEHDRIYNPLTHRALHRGEPDYELVSVLRAGTEEVGRLGEDARRRLAEGGWLVRDDGELSRRFFLRCVALETHSVCNQGCYFCPVRYKRRAAHFMSDQMFDSIVGQLRELRATVEAVFLMSYNEPTVDKRFVEHCRRLLDAGLPAALNSNGSGLTPTRVDELLAVGTLRFLSINLSTADREKYARDRGEDQLELVLKNLDYAQDHRIAEEMVIAVLGEGDDQHRRDVEELSRRYAGSQFSVRSYDIMDRAGHLNVGLCVSPPHPVLNGCENLGSRPLQHLHITPQGRCVLCCEDYDESYVVGNLTESSVREVLTGDRYAELRRFSYGLAEAPADFICRKCIFALTP